MTAGREEWCKFFAGPSRRRGTRTYIRRVLGSGMFINTVLPEAAAEFLRNVKTEQLAAAGEELGYAQGANEEGPQDAGLSLLEEGIDRNCRLVHSS